MNDRPRAGIRLLEVGHILAGPYATMMLADLGAEVIKIEPPTNQATARHRRWGSTVPTGAHKPS